MLDEMYFKHTLGSWTDPEKQEVNHDQVHQEL